MVASTLILVLVSPVNVLLNIVLIHFTNLGILGSPLALSITYWLMFIGLAVFTYFSPTHRSNGTWGGIHLGAIFDPQSCYSCLKLALPGILMVGTEWYPTPA